MKADVSYRELPVYSLARPALFALDSERAHDLTLSALARTAPLARRIYGARVPDAPVEIMGLRLPNPIGLAAGFDKDGRYIDGLAALGFGFIELGTVTPLAQPGNATPRLFRLVEQRGLINRMGFNNDGVEALVERLRGARHDGVFGVNIGRNKKTPHARAIKDYVTCLRAVHEIASYVTINVSSPNTEGLRDMQTRELLDSLLAALVAERDALAETHGRRMPLAVKIAPDLDEDGLDVIAETLTRHGVDAVIATNTTTGRQGLPPRWWQEMGGLSGAPLRARATEVIAGLYARLGDEIPIIGVGGIQRPRDVVDKLDAGARALQLYSGLIYGGPATVRECAGAAARWQRRQRVMSQAAVIKSDRARAAADDRTAGR